MKKSIPLTFLLVTCLASGVLAAGIGSVQVPFDPEVGWAIVNTTASGGLVVVAHLESALPDEDFSVSLRVRYEDGNTDVFQDIAVLSTNDLGRGNVFVRVDTLPPEGSTTIRRVAVRVRRAPQPLYVAVAWDLTLKPGVLLEGIRMF